MKTPIFVQLHIDDPYSTPVIFNVNHIVSAMTTLNGGTVMSTIRGDQHFIEEHLGAVITMLGELKCK